MSAAYTIGNICPAGFVHCAIEGYTASAMVDSLGLDVTEWKAMVLVVAMCAALTNSLS